MADYQILYPEDLPVSGRRAEILEAIRNHQVVVIAGATGSGKTTQIPKMCLEIGRESIAHTQPRRIAARAVAERISAELKVELGGLVGYQVRFTDKVSRETKVKVMTDGILLNALQSDRLLKKYDTVIIDEAHERSLNIDFLLGYLKNLLTQRPDLKVIITSATIDPQSFSKHFNDCPIIEVSGRTYPIEMRYRPVGRDSGDDSDPDETTTSADYMDGISAALKELEAEENGDVLVFLSGESEIRDAQDAIEGQITAGFLKSGTEVLPLYGRLSAADQHRVFEPSKIAGTRKRVILATNVAETSLTIPNIKYVIDAGTARISRYSPRAKVQRLPIEAISQASANQRAGRAGRTSPGICIRLYSKEDFESRPEFTAPEILRTNLASVILQAATIGLEDITKFPFLQPPDSRGVKDGLGLLTELGAIEPSTEKSLRLTPLGKTLARLPIEPRFARMLIEAKQNNVVREVMVIVAGLTIQDPRERPLEKRVQADALHARFADPTSDFLSLVNLWNHVEEQQKQLSSSAFRRLCKKEYLNYLRVREWQDLVRQLSSIAKPLGFEVRGPKVDPAGIHKSLLAGLLSQIGLKQVSDKKQYVNGKLKPSKGPVEYLGSNGKKFVIFPGSALAKKPPVAMMSAELVETSRLFARMNAAIEPEWAEALGGELCKRSFSEPHWEKKMGAAVALERVLLFGVPIVVGRKMQYSRIDPMFSRELFIRNALVLGDWDSRQQFEAPNKALVEVLTLEADRLRDPSLIPDEDVRYSFFNNRIPLDVFSTRSFEGWWRKHKLEKPELLLMTKEKLFEEIKSVDNEVEYPDHIEVDGQVFSLSYRFAPGTMDDGLTVDIPLEILDSVSSDGFDWLVPGMRQELATELIRSLPKAIRKNVVPAADWASKIMLDLGDEPTGGLFEKVAASIQKLTGTVVSASDFDQSKLPVAMRMTYRVIGKSGKPQGSDVDLAALKEKFATVSRQAVAKVAATVHSNIERENISVWDFQELPLLIETESSGKKVRAFPALAIEGKNLSLKVFASEAEQKKRHPHGVARLVQLSIPSPAKYVESHLKQDEKLALVTLGYGSVEGFVEDLIFARALELQEAQPGLVSSKDAFEVLRNRVEAELVEKAFQVAGVLANAAKAMRDAGKVISDARAIDFLSELQNEKQHIAELTSPNLLSAMGLHRVSRLPIYFRGIGMRIQKLQENPARDSAANSELRKALDVYTKAGGSIPLPLDAPVHLSTARWMLEEFRISLFAQSLGTSQPVSLQRIQKALAV